MNEIDASELDRSLRCLATRFASPSVARRLLRRWRDVPELAGRTPDGILAAVTKARAANHRDVFAALVRQGQTGDDAAVELALLALRPALWRLLHERYYGDPDLVDDVFADAAACLRTIDPTLPMLYERVLGRVRSFRSRQIAYAHRRRELEVATPDPDRYTPHDPVGDAATANAVLDALRQLADRGDICPATWRALVVTRGLGHPFADIDDHRSPDHLRSDTSCLARRLERYAA